MQVLSSPGLRRLTVFVPLLLAVLLLASAPALSADTDGDGVDDSVDNCPSVRNGDCALDPDYCDVDGDGTTTAGEEATGQQIDTDADVVGDACDNCLATPNGDCTADPLYCDVIVQRWEKFTGRKAVRDSNRSNAPDIAEALEVNK